MHHELGAAWPGKWNKSKARSCPCHFHAPCCSCGTPWHARTSAYKSISKSARVMLHSMAGLGGDHKASCRVWEAS